MGNGNSHISLFDVGNFLMFVSMVDMALYVAAEYGYADLVKEMIKFHDIAMAGTKSRNGYDAFHTAAK